MSIITLSKITEFLKSFEYNSILHSWNWFILAEDNWNIQDIVLKENEIFINRPFFPAIGVGNSLNIQDEHGFKYRKIRASKRVDRWECIKKNKGCPCSIKTRGETIILQRNEHNHTIEDYRKLRKFWILLRSFDLFLQRTTGTLKALFWPKTKSLSIDLSFMLLLSEIQLLFRMSKASSTTNLTVQKIINIGNAWDGGLAVKVPLKPEEIQLFCKEMNTITIFEDERKLIKFWIQLCLHSRTLFLLAEDNWSNEDVVLKENEILVNRPFFHIHAVGNSVNIQDEEGFRYRKTHDAKHFQHWTCLRRNKGCKVSIRIAGEIITVQRNEHNHTAQVYRQLRKQWNTTHVFILEIDLFLQKTTGTLKIIFQEMMKSWSIDPSFQVLEWEIQL